MNKKYLLQKINYLRLAIFCVLVIATPVLFLLGFFSNLKIISLALYTLVLPVFLLGGITSEAIWFKIFIWVLIVMWLYLVSHGLNLALRYLYTKIKRKEYTPVIVSIVAFLIVVTSVFFIADYQEKQSAEQTMIQWTDISSIPAWAEDEKVRISGSSFARTVTISFKGAREEIDQWIKDEETFSAPLYKVETKTNVIHYYLKPRGGAQGAEVIIDFTQNLITIYTYWS